MLRRFCATLVFLFSLATLTYGQAVGMPLVPAATNGGTHFFVEGDVEWASTKLNGNVEPREYDKTFIPQISLGWNIADSNAVLLNYRYINTQVKETFNLNVPDLESTITRRLNLQNVDITYRERMGGPDAPLGMEVDMGFRFAWSKFRDEMDAATIAGPVNTQNELGFLVGGTRFGIKPYFTFDPSGWKMTIYGQAHLAYLWGTFHGQSWQDQVVQINTRDNSTLFNWDAEVGLSMYCPGLEGILQFTAGYRYEQWTIDRLGFMTSSDQGKLTQYGPFLRLQVSF